MKATGIVRRIDDLGRVVIPKEIRRSFRIKEGDCYYITLKGSKNCCLLYKGSKNGLVTAFEAYCCTESLLKLCQNSLKTFHSFLSLFFF